MCLYNLFCARVDFFDGTMHSRIYYFLSADDFLRWLNAFEDIDGICNISFDYMEGDLIEFEEEA